MYKKAPISALREKNPLKPHDGGKARKKSKQQDTTINGKTAIEKAH